MMTVRDPMVFARRVLVAVALVALVVIVLFIVWKAASVFLLAFAGVLLAIFLRGITSWLHKRTGIPRGWALAVVSIVIVGTVVLWIWLVVPAIGVQVKELSTTLPRAIDNVRQQIEQYAWGSELLDELPRTTDAQKSEESNLLGRIGGFFSSTLGAVADLLIIVIVGLYLAAEPHTYKRGMLLLFPPSARERSRQVIDKIGSTLHDWLFAKLLSMAIAGVMTTIGLWALGMPLALTFGILAALMEFIPNIGPLLAGIPAILIALSHSPQQALYVTLLYVAIQIVQSYLFTPMLEKRAVKLPPALTIITQVMLGILLGGLGLALATPLLAAVIVIVKMLYVESRTEDGERRTEGEARTEKRERRTEEEAKGTT